MPAIQVAAQSAVKPGLGSLEPPSAGTTLVPRGTTAPRFVCPWSPGFAHRPPGGCLNTPLP